MAMRYGNGMEEEEKILTGGGVNSWWLQSADGGWGKKCEARARFNTDNRFDLLTSRPIMVHGKALTVIG